MDAGVLAALVATVPLQQEVRGAERTLASARATEAAAIKAAGVDGITDGGAAIGVRAIAEADAHLAKTADQHADDGLAWHVFNWLSEARPTAPIVRARARSKLDLVSAVPAFVDVEIAWRSQRDDPAAATYLSYWDAGQPIDLATPLWTKVLDALERAGFGLKSEMRADLLAACTEEIPGPRRSELELAGIADATIDDVRAALAAGGAK